MKRTFITCCMLAALAIMATSCKKDENNNKTDGITHEFVDLGLPSGVKWATCNVGAASPTDFGDYFAWGEIQPYYTSLNPLTWKEGKSAGYAWGSYSFTNGSGEEIGTQPCGTNGNLTLEHDAARANWGGVWRMPTAAEIEELLNNTDCTMVTEGGVYGMMCTNKSDASKYIFLPAAGYFDGTSRNHVGERGYCWSATRYSSDSSSAYYLFFYSTDESHGIDSRYFGFTVRPVR